MINSRKKGFTLVELVIVIAVVAILAAVLIPTFSSLVKKANVSADQQAVVQMNKLLKLDEASNGKPANKDAAIKVLLENGYNEGFTTYYKGHSLAWIETENIIVLLEENKVVYPKDYSDATEFLLLKPMAESPEDIISTLTNITSGETIYLNANIDDITSNEEKIKFNDNITYNLDMNGKTINTNTDNINAIYARNGNITIKNGNLSTGASESHILSVGGGENGKPSATPATVLLENMNLSSKYVYSDEHKQGMMAIKTYIADSVLTIKNSKISVIDGGCFDAWFGTINLENVQAIQTGESRTDWTNAIIAASGNGVVNVKSGTYSGNKYCLFIFSSGGVINIEDGEFSADTVINFTLDKVTYSDAKSEMYISGGVFDGLIKVISGCKLEISGGTFSNTGLTLDQFKAFVKAGHSVQEIDGKYIVK